MQKTRLRFFGVAAYEIVNRHNQHILVDPFLDYNPGSPQKSIDLDDIDLIIVSHAAFDHLGDTEAIARRTGAPVICGGEVKNYLVAKGIPESQIRATTWGIAVEVAGIRVQPVECHHWSQIKMPDGSFASGVPMGFVIYVEDNYGDTAIFSDMKLIAELYQPTIGCLGIANPLEILNRVTGPGRLLTAEMSPREGALAAEWLALTTVLPCHYINPDCDEVREFNNCLNELTAKSGRRIKSVVMNPGDWYNMEDDNETM
jgi:L-ascorbate metabolism protein UlaG (beta-lactamase superfamily)